MQNVTAMEIIAIGFSFIHETSILIRLILYIPYDVTYEDFVVQSFLSKTAGHLRDRLQLSVLERCPSYREFSYSEMTEKRQGWDQHQVSVLWRCPLRESWLYNKTLFPKAGLRVF